MTNFAIFALSAFLVPAANDQAIKAAQDAPTLEVVRDARLRGNQGFQDTSGRIWFVGQDTKRGVSAMFRWTGRGWDETPVRQLTHPPWRKHVPPPWTGLSRDIRVIHGRGGRMLAVIVRDMYQDMVDTEAGQRGDRSIHKLAEQWLGEGKRLYWLEAWLLDGEKWSGPMKIDKLLEDHAALLREHFTLPSSRFSFFDLQSDGQWLWVLNDFDVVGIGPNGERLTWRIPAEHSIAPNRHGTSLAAHVNLLLLPEGGAWCMYLDRPPGRYGTFHVVKLEVAGNRVRSAEIPGASFPERRAADINSCLTVTRDKRIWRHYPISAYTYTQISPFVWTGQEWQERKGPCIPMFEDPNGALWFFPPERKSGEPHGYKIIRNGKAATLEWPYLYPMRMGMVTRSGPKTLFVAAESALVTLVRDAKAAAGWRIDKVYKLPKPWGERGGIFDDGRGNIVGVSGWHARLPDVEAGEPATRPAR
ncbi:MAG: hypothetical protein ACYTF6_04230 [Planctomycetota bacterium]|jgi:hypothetical protein